MLLTCARFLSRRKLGLSDFFAIIEHENQLDALARIRQFNSRVGEQSIAFKSQYITHLSNHLAQNFTSAVLANTLYQFCADVPAPTLSQQLSIVSLAEPRNSEQAESVLDKLLGLRLVPGLQPKQAVLVQGTAFNKLAGRTSMLCNNYPKLQQALFPYLQIMQQVIQANDFFQIDCLDQDMGKQMSDTLTEVRIKNIVSLFRAYCTTADCAFRLARFHDALASCRLANCLYLHIQVSGEKRYARKLARLLQIETKCNLKLGSLKSSQLANTRLVRFIESMGDKAVYQQHYNRYLNCLGLMLQGDNSSLALKRLNEMSQFMRASGKPMYQARLQHLQQTIANYLLRE